MMEDEKERVVLVDASDRALGTAPKLEAHRAGYLHRAISVILRDSAGRLLLQKRHAGKYHSGGLWTNACCSHPRPGETTGQAAQRRLAEEMGVSCRLEPLLLVTYRADVGRAMIEHEVVHVFDGLFEGPVRPDPREADGFAWVPAEELRAELARDGQRFTAWFRKYCAEHWDLMTGQPAAHKTERARA